MSELPNMTDTDRTEAIASIRREVARCKSIVQDMSTSELRATNLGPDTGEAWELGVLSGVSDGLPTDVSVRFQFADDANRARVEQPRQIVLRQLREIVLNAIHACRARRGSRGVEVFVRAGDNRVDIEVRDDGVGMDANTLKSAFEPFYTTRAEGEGTGLGLYLTRAQLRQLGGEITLDSSTDRGTTVHLWFPRRLEAITP